MSNYTILSELEQSGTLDLLSKKGIVSINLIGYMKIYRQVDEQLKVRGSQKMVVYQNVADKNGVHINTVINACKWCDL